MRRPPMTWHEGCFRRVASYGVGKYEDALRYFQQAYELSQRPGLLYNIGQAADRLHLDAITVEAFRLFLERVPHTEHRIEVESRLRALERLVDFEASRATQTSLPTNDEPTRGPTVAPWLLVIGGGATLVAGAVVGGIGAQQIADVEQAADGSRWADLKASADSGPTLATIGVVLLSVGAVVTTSGAVWLLSADDGQSTLALGVRPTGVVLAGSL